MRRERGAVVDVVHTGHGVGDPGIDLEHDLLGDIEPRLVVSDRGGGDQFTGFGDAGDFDDRDVDVPVVALPHLLCHVRQVDVDVIHAAVVDASARGRLGLVRHAQSDAVRLGEQPFGLGRHRGSGEKIDREVVTARPSTADVLGKCRGDPLGGTRAREATDRDGVAGANVPHRLLGGNDLAPEGFVADAARGGDSGDCLRLRRRRGKGGCVHGDEDSGVERLADHTRRTGAIPITLRSVSRVVSYTPPGWSKALYRSTFRLCTHSSRAPRAVRTVAQGRRTGDNRWVRSSLTRHRSPNERTTRREKTCTGPADGGPLRFAVPPYESVTSGTMGQ